MRKKIATIFKHLFELLKHTIDVSLKYNAGNAMIHLLERQEEMDTQGRANT